MHVDAADVDAAPPVHSRHAGVKARPREREDEREQERERRLPAAGVDVITEVDGEPAHTTDALIIRTLDMRPEPWST